MLRYIVVSKDIREFMAVLSGHTNLSRAVIDLRYAQRQYERHLRGVASERLYPMLDRVSAVASWSGQNMATFLDCFSHTKQAIITMNDQDYERMLSIDCSAWDTDLIISVSGRPKYLDYGGRITRANPDLPPKLITLWDNLSIEYRTSASWEGRYQDWLSFFAWIKMVQWDVALKLNDPVKLLGLPELKAAA